MAIDFQALSISSAFNSIVNFFRSQENNGKWRDLTIGSEGSFLIRLLANIVSNISYKVITQSRENFLSTAVLPSSNIGISVNLGYSVFRGSNLKRKINITPNGNYTFPKLSVIGSYDSSHKIYTLHDVALEEGVPVDIETVVGNVEEETFTAGTSAIKLFSLFREGISEDYTLWLDSVQVPTTDVIKNMKDDKYLVRTNPYKSVDIMYLNNRDNAAYKYGNGSEITIRYVELEDVPVIPYTDDMISYGTLNVATNISTYLPFETVDEMKINAPLDHETQNLIRSKQDYANRINQIIPSVKDANYFPVTPTYTLITYLKNDFTLLTDVEQEYVRQILKDERFFGTPLADIYHPRRQVAHLKISLVLRDKYTNISDVSLDIGNILENYYNAKLNTTFNVYDLERLVEELSYVKYARVAHVINTRGADTNYQEGYILKHDDRYYIASKILGLSGDSVPEWNLPLDPPMQIDTGLITYDGSIIWRAYKRLPNMPVKLISARQNNMQYGIGDYVYDEDNAPGYMFKCEDIRKTSGFVAPSILNKEPGDFVADGGLVWVIKEKSETYPNWESLKRYKLGDSVSTSGLYSLECVGYTGTTGTDEELEFEEPTYSVYEQQERAFVVLGDKTFYFRPNDAIEAISDEDATKFIVVSSSYIDGLTYITVNREIDSGTTYYDLAVTQRGTRDGQVLWTLVDNIENIEYPWDSYMVFDHEVEIEE